ncbi:phosphate propanoyltransferase [Clostridium sp. CAG:1193]|jgi:putative phosphotransacetylase|nr:phosphate propanoyltransferase [Clostridium sp. CAG:1193]
MGDFMKVKIGVSARHVHLTKDDFKKLFGYDELTWLKDLTQPNEFASKETVSIITEKGRINNVRILGPFRDYTQVEISKTDAYSLKINPPIRKSGDLVSSEIVTMEHDGNTITKECCIIATRHIHINTKDLKRYNLENGEVVKLRLDGIKGGILNNVFIKASDNYTLEAHIDLDDANAHFINDKDEGEIINE